MECRGVSALKTVRVDMDIARRLESLGDMGFCGFAVCEGRSADCLGEGTQERRSSINGRGAGMRIVMKIEANRSQFDGRLRRD